ARASPEPDSRRATPAQLERARLFLALRLRLARGLDGERLQALDQRARIVGAQRALGILHAAREELDRALEELLRALELLLVFGSMRLGHGYGLLPRDESRARETSSAAPRAFLSAPAASNAALFRGWKKDREKPSGSPGFGGFRRWRSRPPADPAR